VLSGRGGGHHGGFWPAWGPRWCCWRRPARAPRRPQTAAAAVGLGEPCRQWVARLPGLSAAQCGGLRLQASGTRSVQGRELWVGDIGPRQARLKVLVLGAIHGDELSASTVALHWMGLAQDNGAGALWRFVPMLNPDGVQARPARRVNAHGIDLNRNFPTPRWDQEAPRYWAQRTRKDPRRWPGNKALSEPESRFVHEQMGSFAPSLIVSIHAPYGVLDFDGPTEPPRRLGRLMLDPVGVFPGSLGYYGGAQGRAGGDHRTAQCLARAAAGRDAPDVAGPAALDGRAPGGSGPGPASRTAP
jgi:hypothetical protein